MANHPDPSQQPEHPDNTHKKPTPPPTEPSMGGAADLHGEEPTTSDSFIDLGMPGGPADPFASNASAEPHEPSDISIVEWAALVEEAAPSDQGAAAQIDRPSDQDWVPQPPTLAKPEPTALNRPDTHHALDVGALFADPADVIADAAAHSGAAAPPPAHDSQPEIHLLNDESSAEQESLAADLEVVRQTFNLDELDSQKNLASPARVTPEEEDIYEEEVNLSGAPVASGSFSSSGVDLQQLDSGSFEHIVEEVAAEADAPSSSASGVDLGSAELPRLTGSGSAALDAEDALDQPPSGRDLIAEAVESGVDMHQPLMEIVEEETLAEEAALEAGEVVESGVEMKQPLLEIVEEEEALEAGEVVESSEAMKQPLMDIVDEEEEVLEATEVVESSGAMKQPLMEIVEEEAMVEAGEVVEEEVIVDEEIVEAGEVDDEGPSSAVNLGGPVETVALTREEKDALMAGQEMGAAAEQPVQTQDGESAEKDGRKTVLAGRHPVRTTQMQGPEIEDENVAEAGDLVEEQIVSEAAEVAAEDVVFEEIVNEAGPVSDQGLVVEETAAVEQEIAAADAGEVVEEEAAEVAYEDGGEFGEDVSEIVLKPDHPTIDSSVNLEELAGSGASDIDLEGLLGEGGSKAGADSGVLLDKLKGKKKPAVDPEEVQLGEGAVEEMEEMPAAVDEEVEEEAAKPAKPQKQRSRALAFMGGGFLGTLVSVGGCFALFYFLTGEFWPAARPKTTPPPVVQGKDNKPPPAQTPVTFEAQVADLHNGNLERAEKDGIEKIDETKPEQLAARGEFRWLKYLSSQAKEAGPIKVNKEDPLVAGALADLKKASENPDNKAAAANALFHLAQISEFAGELPVAQNLYSGGAEKYKDDPKLKRMFQAAVDRLSVRGPVPAGMMGLLDPQRGVEDQAFVLAMLICLQQPPPADNTDDEAGFAYWDAVKKARALQYGEAIKALDAARAIHDKRRFQNLRKAQNPLSDPTEEIFLRACDELKMLWTVQDKLREKNYLTKEQPDTGKAVAQFLDVLQQYIDFHNAQADKLLAAKIIEKREDVMAGIDKMLADRKTDEKKIADLDKMLKDEMDAFAVLDKKLTEQKNETEAKAKEAMKANDKAMMLSKDLMAEQATVAKLKGQMEKMQDIVNEKDPQGKIRKLQVDLDTANGTLNATLKERWAPSDMLSIWLPVLEKRPEKDLAAKALIDADRVLKDKNAKPEDQARANVLKGLALRNDDQFAESKTMLTEAKKGIGANSPWQKAADEALKEVSNPAATYLARVQEKRSKGDYGAALAAFQKAIEALPADQTGELLAERSLMLLEEARSKKQGPLTADDLMAAQDDAKKATAAGSVQGLYALGRIAEELGQWPDAVAAYRKAVEATPDLNAQSSRYRVSLARALQQSRAKNIPPKEAPKDDKTSRLPVPEGADARMLAVLLTTALQPPKLPSRDDQEAKELADAVIKANEAKPGSIPFDVLSQAYLVRGQYTEALKTYAAGLKTEKKLAPEYADGLMQLIETHPILKRPIGDTIANPLNAEKHYGAGLRWYYERDYANAEKEFTEAIKSDDQDARYHYFLGLARVAQNKEEGYEDFAQGAKLEMKDRPTRAAVSMALERVQGPMREAINEARRQAR